MEKHIVGENGMAYTLGKDGLYYPDLRLPEGTNYEIEKYGRMRCDYLKLHRRVEYMELLLGGKINEYLHEIDEECYRLQEQLIAQMKKEQGVTEQLKAENQMLWVGKMNNIRNSVEEIVLSEMIYC